MCDQDHFEEDRLEYESRGLVTRKQFGVLLGAGISMLLPPVEGAVKVVEAEVTIKTPDGEADCYFVHPAKGNAPGVLLWPDIFGLRPAMKQMGKRLAESGYSVLVVNPFYRAKKAPTSNGSATPIQEVMPLARALNETTHMTDAKAFIGWLDTQKSVSKKRKMGTQGYCMGGPIAFRTAAAMPARVGAVASFHGGGLVVKDNPSSPHLQAAKTKASFLVAIADNDDKRAPTDKDVLKETFGAAKLAAEIEVYADAAHGWCPPDSRVYNEGQAEKAWTRLLALYSKL